MAPTSEPLSFRSLPWRSLSEADAEAQVSHEWLVTNGLGGYASGTVSGVCTRRYHGLLIASLLESEALVPPLWFLAAMAFALGRPRPVRPPIFAAPLDERPSGHVAPES